MVYAAKTDHNILIFSAGQYIYKGAFGKISLLKCKISVFEKKICYNKVKDRKLPIMKYSP